MHATTKMPSPIRVVCLGVLEVITLIVFIQHWATQPGNMVSEFLYRDATYRRLLTFYTLLHLAVLYMDSKHSSQKKALGTAALGWCALIICSNRGPRLGHAAGVLVYGAGVYAYVIITSTHYTFPVNRIAQAFVAMSLGLALAYGVLELQDSRDTWMVQHPLFLMLQMAYSWFALFDDMFKGFNGEIQ